MEIKICGLNCHYTQQGEGRDVLLLHGWGGCVDSWLPVTDHLKGKARVTVIDFPGHGKSDPPPAEGWGVPEYCALLSAFIAEVGIAGCDIVAHSFGGRVALMLAATQPKLAGRLLLTGCAGLLPRRGALYHCRTALFKGLKKLSYLVPGGNWAREKVSGRVGSEDYRALPPAMKATFIKVVNEDLGQYLPRITAETLLVWGRSDTATPLWMGQRMEKEMPNAALVVLEGGHFVYLEQCAAFLRILDAYFFPKNA